MLQQAIDFRDESDVLYTLVEPLAEDDFNRVTLFESWTINNVLAHLHFFNYVADLSLNDKENFIRVLNQIGTAANNGKTLVDMPDLILGVIKGRELLKTWQGYYLEMADRFAAADPKKRVKWFGPDMSVRSSITARLMETWAHAQEIYDLMGVKRVNHDRIKNIAFLGVNTFGWTFINRGEEVPPDIPYLRLTAPSGEIWEWNDPSASNVIDGLAEEFCQVVTQVRNIADTKLRVEGKIANQWMSIAQCFAGPPENPPPPGTRC